VGNDGGGSIRIPASLCGVVGMKPQFGRVPSWPHAMHNYLTLNHEGPMARTVSDTALLLGVMAGSDERDRSSLPGRGADYLGALGGTVGGTRVAFTADLAAAAVEPEVAEIARGAAFAFADMGCEVAEDDPGIFDLAADLAVLVIAETGAEHEHHLDEAAEMMYPPYKPFLELAGVFTARDLARVEFHRADLWERMWPFFEKYDVLMTPTTACAAFDLVEGGMVSPEKINGIEVGPANWIPFTFPFNFTGQPAISVPCGFTASGLPVGLQIIGRRYDEATVLSMARAFEQACPWADRHPAL
jgi:Asp-tRNA(Asn)/Glu-tRNA(Gln) amidotransferase A subunit family amidase